MASDAQMQRDFLVLKAAMKAKQESLQDIPDPFFYGPPPNLLPPYDLEDSMGIPPQLPAAMKQMNLEACLSPEFLFRGFDFASSWYVNPPSSKK